MDQVLKSVSVPRSLSRSHKRFIVGGLYFMTQDWFEKNDGRTAKDMTGEVLALLGM